MLSKKILNVNTTHIAFGGILIAIYFQLYWHYWLVKILQGRVINSFIPILLIFYVCMVREFISSKNLVFKKMKIYWLLLPLSCYALFATNSIFLNEEGINKIKSCIIYIYSPILVFISIIGIYIYRRNENISLILKLIFCAGIIFSLYVVFLFAINPVDPKEMVVLYTNRGESVGDTGGRYGIGDIEMIRYTIPGMSSNTYGALLVPLVLAGIYFIKKSNGKLKYIYAVSTVLLTFCIFQSVSRGAIISLIAGLGYLMWQKWFKLKSIIIVVSMVILSFLTFAKALFLRLIITVAMIFPFDVSHLAYDAFLQLDDPRIHSLPETLSYISHNPFFGLGMSNLSYVQDSSFGKEHNNYLSIGASFGIPALIFYILFLIFLLVMINRNIKKLPPNTLARDTGVLFCAVLLALIVYLNFVPAEFHFIWIWFGLAAAWLRNCEDGFLFKKPATYKLCIEKI